MMPHPQLGMQNWRRTVAIHRIGLPLWTACILASCLVSCGHTSARDQSCGRDLSANIHLIPNTGLGQHPPSVENISVTKLLNTDAEESVTAFSARADWETGRGYFTSRDAGRTWKSEYGGTPVSLAVSGFNPLQSSSNINFAYKYDPSLGIYLRSEDGGRSWGRPLYALDKQSQAEFSSWLQTKHTLDFTLVAIHPEDPKRLYATFRLLPQQNSPIDDRVYAPDRLYHSEDGGESWNPLPQGFMNRAPLGISTRNSNVIYGISPIGQLLRSTDSGTSWHITQEKPLTKLLSQVSLGYEKEKAHERFEYPLMIRQILVDPLDESTIYVVMSAGVLRSVNGGGNWRLLDLGFDEINSVNSLAVSPRASHTLYVGTMHGLLASRDGGCTFAKIFPAGNRGTDGTFSDTSKSNR